MIATLITPRLTLRAARAEDAAALGRFISGPRSPGIGGPSPASAAAEWIAHVLGNWQRRGCGLWDITLTAIGEAIGRSGVLHHDGWPEPELAWHLYDGFEEQGFRAEAAAAARDHLQGPLGLPPMFSFVEPPNTRSRGVARRLGAVVERQAEWEGLTFDIFRHRPGASA